MYALYTKEENKQQKNKKKKIMMMVIGRQVGSVLALSSLSEVIFP